MNTTKAKHFHLIEDMDIAALTFAAVERVEAFASDIKAVVSTWVFLCPRFFHQTTRRQAVRIAAGLAGQSINPLPATHKRFGEKLDQHRILVRCGS
jgi:hypothetical protein